MKAILSVPAERAGVSVFFQLPVPTEARRTCRDATRVIQFGPTRAERALNKIVAAFCLGGNTSPVWPKETVSRNRGRNGESSQGVNQRKGTTLLMCFDSSAPQLRADPRENTFPLVQCIY